MQWRPPVVRGAATLEPLAGLTPGQHVPGRTRGRAVVVNQVTAGQSVRRYTGAGWKT